LRVNLLQDEAGLDKDSAIMIDQVRAIDKKRLIRKIGTVQQSKISQIEEEGMKVVLGLL